MKLTEAEGTYKGFNVVPLGSFNLVEIKAVGQGPVPEFLRGLYTSQVTAMRMIDQFTTEKEKSGGKTTSRSKG